MGRLMFSFAVLMMFAGCRGQTTAFDPFATYGPTRIPPPPTGTARRPDPYYRGTLSSNPAEPTYATELASRPAQRRFTSQDERAARTDVADRRSADSRSNLDWRSPIGGRHDSRSSPGLSAPRPRFQSRTRQARTRLGLPNEPLVLRESAIGAARPTVGSGSVTPSFGVAPAGYQGSTTDDARWHARY